MRLAQRAHNLCLAFGYNVLAFPQPRESSSLPGRLESLLPQCAQSCVSIVARSAWPSSACSSRQDIGCLCRSESTSGFTLGEIGIQCIASSCPESIHEDSVLRRIVYFVCSDQEDALPNTHSILTATAPEIPAATRGTPAINANIVVTGTADVEPAPTPSSLSISESSQPSPSQETQASLSASRTLLVSSPSSTQSQTQQVSSQTTSPTPQSDSALTSGQIAGVAVSGSIAFVIFVVATLIFCLRIRKKRLRTRGETSGFRVLSSPHLGFLEKGREETGVADTGKPNIAQAPQGVQPGSLRPVLKLVTSNDAPKPDEIGIAISAESVELQQMQRDTPREVFRENSALLPDKPVYHPVTPARVHRRPSSHRTVFEDDGSSDYNGSITTATSCRNSFDFATAYYSDQSRANDHLRGYQFTKELGRSPITTHPEFVSDAYTPRLNRSNSDDDTAAVSPISPERLKYPPIPQSLSNAIGKLPARPAGPDRNDTYTRNEDLVIATTQALTRATGSPLWTERKVLADPDRDLMQLHLKDEVDRARRGLTLMKERNNALAATNSRNGRLNPASGSSGRRTSTRRRPPPPPPPPPPHSAPAGLGLFPRVPSATHKKPLGRLPR